jgi:hypothetical protein
MSDILIDLYYGRISGWERHRLRTTEEKTVNRKIEAEKRYFIEKMSLDDCKRFQELENLYTQAHGFDEIDAYRYGFKLGVMLMSAVFTGEGEM